MSERRSRILLADDHPVILAGLCKLLEPAFKVAGRVTDGLALLAAVERLRPDLVIADIEMPGLDGIEATRRLQASLPDVKVLILSIHGEPSFVRAALDAGAWGYLPKTAVPGEIKRAVHEVLAGCFYISPVVARAAITQVACHPMGSLPEGLTLRELDILRLAGLGLGNQEIACKLGVPMTTIRSHLSEIYDKLDLARRVELALLAVQGRGLAPAPPA
jgi:DNA-binding NarL/FixJ family response regulator